MKLLMCVTCGDVVQMRLEHRSCFCGASGGRYLEDRSTVEQTAGSLSIALNNQELRSAVDTHFEAPQAWHPHFVFRAYLNPHCETDIRYVPVVEVPGKPAK